MNARQLTLPFGPGQHASLANFVPGANAELVERCREPPRGFSAVAIHGAAGSGRSHLLQAVCRHHAGCGVRAAYLPLAGAPRAPGMVDGLERYELVAIDDLDRWLGAEDLERALIALYQALVAAGAALIFTSGTPPADLHCRFDDLASRLRAAQVFGLRELSDGDRARVLQERARARGFDVPRTVLRYWMTHGRRGLAGLLEDLDRLDEASLREHRRLTVPLVKRVLGL